MTAAEEVLLEADVHVFDAGDDAVEPDADEGETPEEEAEMLAWRKKEREFNLEAARRAME